MNDDATRVNPVIANVMESAGISIDLYYRGHMETIRAESLPYVVGRDSSCCNLAVITETASRKHCTFVVRDGQLGLEDHSTNGTMVKVGQGDCVRIKDRFYPLSGQGCIKLGAKIQLDDPDLLLYRLIK